MKTLTSTTNSNRWGFTAVELLLVVIIIALGATMGLGYFAGTFKNTQLRKSARDLVVAARYARMTAIEKHSKVKLVIDQVQGGFHVLFDIENPESGELTETIVSNSYCRPVMLPEGVLFQKVDIKPAMGYAESEEFEGDVVNFYPDGRCNMTTVELTNGKNVYSVVMYSASGKIDVMDEAAQDVQNDVIDLDAGQGDEFEEQ